jgi:exodeoxyribonuclease-1
MPHTFYWHDYETFGAQARRDRPAQFAGIRTDAELNEIGEPLMIYCKPAPDFLPDPQSCLITGITPQVCLERGIAETEFAAQIERELARSDTIGVGYNTIRFDDEVTRFMFWRNLSDPYAREWQNGCGRWDILDMVRTAYALRPEGIEWPTHEDGRASFRLEQLTAANGLAHEAAHDALSDVRATIALARLIRQRQPKLFDFCFALHKKDKAAEEVGMPGQRPFLHVSGMIPVERGCAALMWPLAVHPTNKNEILCWDLAFDPAELAGLDAATVRQRLFTKLDDLPEGTTRLPIKSVHLNKSPIAIANTKAYLPVLEQRWQFDAALAMKHAEHAQRLPDLSPLWREVFQRPNEAAPDVDEDLYGGFIGNGDKRQLAQLRKMSPEQLAKANPAFDDARLDEILFRYRARNFPSSLNRDEQQRWEDWRAARLIDGAGGARSAQQLFDEIDTLQETADERGEEILGALYDYAEMIIPAQQ